MNTLSLLKTAGLTQNQAKVFHALTQIKQGSALDIAKKSHVQRSTVYLVLNTLVEMKLVRRSLYRGVTDYRSNGIGALRQHVSRQRAIVQRGLPHMQRIYDKRTKKVRVRTYHGRHGLKTLCEKILKEEKTPYFLGDEAPLFHGLGVYGDFFHKRLQQRNLTICTKQRKGDIGMLLWGNKVAFIQFGENIQVVAFRSPTFYDYHMTLWKKY